MPAEIAHDDDANMEGVFFWFEPDDREYCMEFQRTLEPDAQDREQGLDTVSITYFGATVYGAIKEWELEDKRIIRMKTTSKAARRLGIPAENRFSCDDVDDIRPYYEKVREMLVATGELKAE